MMINQIPLLNLIKSEDNHLKFKIGKLRLYSEKKFRHIHNVIIEISEEITISFNDKEHIIAENWDAYDYEFEYKHYTFLFKEFRLIKINADGYRKATARKITISKGKINNNMKIEVWELIDKSSLGTGTFEYEKFKINIAEINDGIIKETYNAKSYFYYTCPYNQIREWNVFIWRVYLMLRFYTGNLLLPQTKIIIDEYDNFKIIFEGFKNFGEARSIFMEGRNNFSNFLETSFEIFNEKWEIYNLLFTYWITLNNHSFFIETNNLSGFVLFEILVKNFTTLNKSEFPDKLKEMFDLQNFNLKSINETFFEEFMEGLQKNRDIYLQKDPNNELISEIFEFYEEMFIIYYLQVYRNKIVHDGMIDLNKDILPEILNKIHDKIDKKYSENHILPRKTIKNFLKYQNTKGTFWKGFRKGFKIANEQKREYSQEFNDNIKPIINEINETLNKFFIENPISLMDSFKVFDQVIILFLIKLLEINCILPNENTFKIKGKLIYTSEEYISEFLK